MRSIDYRCLGEYRSLSDHVLDEREMSVAIMAEVFVHVYLGIL